MGKKSGSGSGMNNPDRISESLETIFWGLKCLNLLMQIRDPGWNKFGSGIRDKHPGSATLLIPNVHKFAKSRMFLVSSLF
jgi:hypothetical protein